MYKQNTLECRNLRGDQNVRLKEIYLYNSIKNCDQTSRRLDIHIETTKNMYKANATFLNILKH